MDSIDFEGAFDRFLERREYDQASDALFTAVRAAFAAGWAAAGGEMPVPQKILTLLPGAPKPPIRQDPS